MVECVTQDTSTNMRKKKDVGCKLSFQDACQQGIQFEGRAGARLFPDPHVDGYEALTKTS